MVRFDKLVLYITVMILAFDGLLLLHFNRSEKLPLIKNKLFKRYMHRVVFGASVSVIAEILGVFQWTHCNVLNITLIVAYVISFEILFLYIFLGLMGYLGFWDVCIKYKKQIIAPCVIECCLVLISIFTGSIFAFHVETGYIKGPFFFTQHLVPGIYLALFIAYYATHMNESAKRSHTSLWLILAVAYSGIIANYITGSPVVLNLITAISAVMAYVGMVEWRRFKSSETNTYNTEALMYMIDEYKMLNEDLYISGIWILNYRLVVSHFGELNSNEAIYEVSSWLKEVDPTNYVFYTNEDALLLVSTTPIDDQQLIQHIYSRFPQAFKTSDIEAIFWGQAFRIENVQAFTSGRQCIETCMYALKHYNNEEEELFLIDESCIEKVNRMNKVRDVLSKKIDQKDILVYYQPLYATKTNKIEGAEALVRLYDEELGLLMPFEFIPIAESNGKIHSLGLLVFEETCKYVKTHDIAKSGLQFINVNLSPLQFQDRHLVERLKEIADMYEVDFSLFDFEITETAITNESLLQFQILTFAKYGASVSLDDFGTGNSNLQRLTLLPFNVAKIDMSLVWNYFDGKDSIMEDVIHMFQTKNLKIVAEGVETKEMVDGLTALGCDYLQGYYFSKPVEASVFDALLEKYNK